MIKKRIISLLITGLLLASTSQHICAMWSWSKQEESEDLQQAKQQNQDHRLIEKKVKDPSFELLYRLITKEQKESKKLENRVIRLEQPGEGEVSLPNVAQRLIALEDANYSDKIEGLRQLNEQLDTTLQERQGQLDQVIEKTNEFEEQIKKFKIKNGKFANAIGENIALPGKLTILEKKLKTVEEKLKKELEQRDQAINELKIELKQRDEQLQQQDEKLEKHAKQLEILYQIVEETDFQTYIDKLKEKFPRDQKQEEDID